MIINDSGWEAVKHGLSVRKPLLGLSLEKLLLWVDGNSYPWMGKRMPQAHLSLPGPLSGNFTTEKMRMNWLSLPWVSIEKIVLNAKVAHLHTNNLPALKAKAPIWTLVLAWLQKEPQGCRKIYRGTLAFRTQSLWTPHQNSGCFGWFYFSLLQFKSISLAVLGPFLVWSYSL